MITVRIVDVQKGVSEFAASEKASSENVLDVASVNITKKLVGNVLNEDDNYFDSENSSTGMARYYLRGFVPGWGQFYSGRLMKSYYFMGAFVLSSLFAAYSVYDWHEKKSEYEAQKPPQEAIDKKYDDYHKAAKNTEYAFGIVGVVYLINWIDILFVTKPENLNPENGNKVKTGFHSSQNIYVSIDISSFVNLYQGGRFNFQMGIRF